MPTFLATLCICMVFVPVFLLQGTAKYLFSPLSVSVIVSLLASLALSFTLVPVLCSVPDASGRGATARPPLTGSASRPSCAVHRGFERGFENFRETVPQRALPGRLRTRARR